MPRLEQGELARLPFSFARILQRLLRGSGATQGWIRRSVVRVSTRVLPAVRAVPGNPTDPRDLIRTKSTFRPEGSGRHRSAFQRNRSRETARRTQQTSLIFRPNLPPSPVWECSDPKCRRPASEIRSASDNRVAPLLGMRRRSDRTEMAAASKFCVIDGADHPTDSDGPRNASAWARSAGRPNHCLKSFELLVPGARASLTS